MKQLYTLFSLLVAMLTLTGGISNAQSGGGEGLESGIIENVIGTAKLDIIQQNHQDNQMENALETGEEGQDTGIKDGEEAPIIDNVIGVNNETVDGSILRSSNDGTYPIIDNVVGFENDVIDSHAMRDSNINYPIIDNVVGIISSHSFNLNLDQIVTSGIKSDAEEGSGDSGLPEISKGETDIFGEVVGQAQFNVYPNPAVNFVHVEFAEETQATIELFNVLGQKIEAREGFLTKESFELSELRNGIYMFRIVSGNVEIVKHLYKGK